MRLNTAPLIDTYSDISRNLDSGSQTDITFLDFANIEAFDSVRHDLIVHKLQMALVVSYCSVLKIIYKVGFSQLWYNVRYHHLYL